MKKRTKLLKALLPKSGSTNFSKLLDLYSKEDIWAYLGGYENASELVRFAKHGYDDLLVQNHDLFPGDSVLVMGAYKGSSIERWLQNYKVKVLAVEPVNAFVEVLRKKFIGNLDVEIHPHALGESNGLVDLFIDEYSTGSFTNAGVPQKFEIVDVGEFLLSLDSLPKVVEINIEGGEYDVLQRMIELDLVKNINCFLIQFHNYGVKCEVARAQIRMTLWQTHRCTFNYDWVWERWDKQ
jgi:FkbM family methyltransferase